MRALDVVVHASTQPEPFGLVIAEAMACGRAVITSAAGGAAEIIDAGVDAITHPPGDAASLSACMVRLARDPLPGASLASARGRRRAGVSMPNGSRAKWWRCMKRSADRPPSAPPSQWGLRSSSSSARPRFRRCSSCPGRRASVSTSGWRRSQSRWRLLAWWGSGHAKHSKVHPAQTWLLVAIIYLAAMVLHPFTSSTLAGIAQLVLYVSVMAPSSGRRQSCAAPSTWRGC